MTGRKSKVGTHRGRPVRPEAGRSDLADAIRLFKIVFERAQLEPTFKSIPHLREVLNRLLSITKAPFSKIQKNSHPKRRADNDVRTVILDRLHHTLFLITIIKKAAHSYSLRSVKLKFHEAIAHRSLWLASLSLKQQVGKCEGRTQYLRSAVRGGRSS